MTTIRFLQTHGLMVRHASNWGMDRYDVRGHGVEGVLSMVGRWPEDPSPALYLAPLGCFDRMANAFCAAVPTSKRGVRHLLRAVRNSDAATAPRFNRRAWRRWRRRR